MCTQRMHTFLSGSLIMRHREVFEWGSFCLSLCGWDRMCAPSFCLTFVFLRLKLNSFITFSSWQICFHVIFLQFFFFFRERGWALKYMLSDLIHILRADLHKLHWLKNCLFDDKINWKVMHLHREGTILLYAHHPSLELTWLQLCKCIPSALCNPWNNWYVIMR